MKLFAVAIIVATATSIKLEAVAERQAINFAEAEAENMSTECKNAKQLWLARKDAGLAGEDWRGISETYYAYWMYFNGNQNFCRTYLEKYGDTDDNDEQNDTADD